MRRTGRKITLGLIVIVLGAGVLLKVIPPETDVALNDQHLVSIDGTLVTNPLDLSEVTQKSSIFPLSPVALVADSVSENGPPGNTWAPELSDQRTTAFFPPLASPSSRGKPDKMASPSPSPSVTAPDEPAANQILPPVIASDGGQNASTPSTGGASGGNGSEGNGGNTGSGSGAGSGPGAGSGTVSPPAGSTDGSAGNEAEPDGPFLPLPSVPPGDLGSNPGPSPSDDRTPSIPDPVVDQPSPTIPDAPTHSVPDTSSTFSLLVLAAIAILSFRHVASSPKFS